MKIFRCMTIAALAFAPNAFAATPIPVESFVRFPEIKDARLSLNGRHIAIVVPRDEQTGFAILDISTYPQIKFVSSFSFPPNEHVENIYWANDERVLFTSSLQFGTLNVPRLTGRLYARDIDGENTEMVYGTNFDTDFYFKDFSIIDFLRDDPGHILISSYAGDRDRPLAQRLNIEKARIGLGSADLGRTRLVARSPLPGGGLLADSKGVPRFAFDEDDELRIHIAYRETEEAEWQRQVLNLSGDIWFIDFGADDRTIIVDTETEAGMGIHRLDPVSGKLTPALISAQVQPDGWLYDLDTERVSGVVFDGSVVENRFLDDSTRTARLYKLLGEAFKGLRVRITSSSRDGSVALVGVSNDQMSPDYYLFNTKTGQAQFLLSSRSWLDPNLMARRKAVSFKARDGQEIPAYLTLPNGVPAKDLPLVVLVHGGPHGIRDYWSFDPEAQLLANRGYAVLQTNYRGSGGYRAAFETAGYGRWGTLMQDDIHDGAQWAIDQGIADAGRVCIYGASYGGYSVMQSLVRYPDFYQCGFAFVGVYDLPLMFKEGDVSWELQGQNYLKKVLGTDVEAQRAQSPTHHAGKIKAPVYLVHGKEDQRAHVDHYYRMTEALDEAGIEYESWLVPREGHGFYKMENRVKLYEELLGFLDEHIGE